MTDELAVLRSLNDLSQKLLEKMNLEEVLASAAKGAAELTSSAHSLVRILDTTGKKVLTGARGGSAQQDESGELPFDEGGLGWVVENKGVLKVDRARDDSRVDVPERLGPQDWAVLDVPLVHHGQIFGDLLLFSEQEFSDKDELLVSIYANCAAPVIDQARSQRLSVTDTLTLAYNARYLVPRLKEEMSRAQRYENSLSLLLMDLDKFRSVNSHGRAAGDVVLQRFAERVRAAVRLSDVLVRIGGDEFALILTNTDRDAALYVAERLCQQVSESPILQDSHGVSIIQTVAIGVASWSGKETPQELEAQAETALGKASKDGGNKAIAFE